MRGLNPRADYNISLRVRPADKFRYKYINMQWAHVTESEVLQNEGRQVFLHPSSPNSGEFWMRKPISFKSVKVTHNSSSVNGNVSTVDCAWRAGRCIQLQLCTAFILHIISACSPFSLQILLYTMHKYQLQLEVLPAETDRPFKINIPETTFIAVTSYQNNQVCRCPCKMSSVVAKCLLQLQNVFC